MLRSDAVVHSAVFTAMQRRIAVRTTTRPKDDRFSRRTTPKSSPKNSPKY